MKDLSSNDFAKQSLAQAIEEMKSLQGEDFSINTINLAELQRRTGISRQRLRTLKANGFKYLPHARTGRSNQTSVLDGYTAIIDNLLKQGVTNSKVCMQRITEYGYAGSLSTVKRYISTHKGLVPAKRQLLLLRGAAGTDSLLNPAKPFRWTGDSLKSSIPLDRNSMLPVLPWYVITVVNAMWNSFPMPDRKICLSECCTRLHSWAFQDMF